MHGWEVNTGEEFDFLCLLTRKKKNAGGEGERGNLPLLVSEMVTAAMPFLPVSRADE